MTPCCFEYVLHHVRGGAAVCCSRTSRCCSEEFCQGLDIALHGVEIVLQSAPGRGSRLEMPFHMGSSCFRYHSLADHF
eukprot:5677896-Pyramimonas_sp.AAC.1